VKCNGCYVELRNAGTVHLMTTNIGTTSIPVQMKVCPKCGRVTLVKIE